MSPNLRRTRTANRIAVGLGGGAVPAEQWRSLAEAAAALGVSEQRVRLLVSNDHLRPARNAAGEVGVQAASVEQEHRWRSSAGRGAKARRLVRDVLVAL